MAARLLKITRNKKQLLQKMLYNAKINLRDRNDYYGAFRDSPLEESRPYLAESP
jgi:hypothetical protein